ncbi:hypothetical protein [Amycolatopsis sp. NPDC051903]|uniref:hypothetical protein n=1 Tax=Amycolatopsis sp. NPDC051903 TaxID=3363936 RepID=UPI0037B0C997
MTNVLMGTVNITIASAVATQAKATVGPSVPGRSRGTAATAVCRSTFTIVLPPYGKYVARHIYWAAP